MMEEEEGLHELDQYFPDYIYIEALIVLCFDVAVDVDAEHFGDDALGQTRVTMCPRN